MLKAIGYFAIGLFAGLTVAELMKDAKPVEKITIYDGYIVRYDYPHYYRYGYDYYYRPLEVRQYRQYTPVRGGSRGGSSGGGEGGSGTTHTGTVRKDISDRKKTWGTKY
jgi:uncharacterized membrane protein